VARPGQVPEGRMRGGAKVSEVGAAPHPAATRPLSSPRKRGEERGREPREFEDRFQGGFVWNQCLPRFSGPIYPQRSGPADNLRVAGKGTGYVTGIGPADGSGQAARGWRRAAGPRDAAIRASGSGRQCPAICGDPSGRLCKLGAASGTRTDLRKNPLAADRPGVGDRATVSSLGNHRALPRPASLSRKGAFFEPKAPLNPKGFFGVAESVSGELGALTYRHPRPCAEDLQASQSLAQASATTPRPPPSVDPRHRAEGDDADRVA